MSRSELLASGQVGPAQGAITGTLNCRVGREGGAVSVFPGTPVREGARGAQRQRLSPAVSLAGYGLALGRRALSSFNMH